MKSKTRMTPDFDDKFRFFRWLGHQKKEKIGCATLCNILSFKNIKIIKNSAFSGYLININDNDRLYS